MTETETIKILAMLGAFYGGGKTDPKAQVNAWHAILQKYPYAVAEKAVFDFAENDVRDYATFPAVGKIVQAIKQEQNRAHRAVDDIIVNISYGRDYESLSSDSKQIMSKSVYDNWLSVDAEEFAQSAGTLKKNIMESETLVKALQG